MSKFSARGTPSTVSVTTFAAGERVWISREDSTTGCGLRFSTEIYGSKRQRTVFHECLHKDCLVLTVEKSPKISGNLRESTGELGILYSSSLLGMAVGRGGVRGTGPHRTPDSKL